MNFHYDEKGLPIAITGPSINSGTRVYARFYYKEINLNVDIPYVKNPNKYKNFKKNYPALSAIYFPGNQTGYVFYNYTTYGIPKSVSVNRSMSISTDALNAQGNFNHGAITKITHFDFPDSLTNEVFKFGTNLPTYSKKVETWVDVISGQDQQAITSYDTSAVSQGLVSVIAPDGTKTVQRTEIDPDKWTYGLANSVESWGNDDKLLQTISYTWEQSAKDKIPYRKK